VPWILQLLLSWIAITRTMRPNTLSVIVSVALVVVVGLSGCGGGSSGTISGTVKMDGKPLAGASVNFEGDSASKLGGFGGVTDDQGKFVIQVKGAEIKAGKYRVLINKYVDPKGKAIDPEELEQLKASGTLKNIVPTKYNSVVESELIVDLKPGANELQPFDLKSK
jgi:hypothetical protein